MRYTDDAAVARVFVRVEYADGRIREYEAREPRDFQVSDPASMSSMKVRPSGMSLPAGGGFRPVRSAVPSLRLSFTAHPGRGLHVRTEATAPEKFEGITYPVPRSGAP
jgi:hypothetical protein